VPSSTCGCYPSAVKDILLSRRGPLLLRALPIGGIALTLAALATYDRHYWGAAFFLALAISSFALIISSVLRIRVSDSTASLDYTFHTVEVPLPHIRSGRIVYLPILHGTTALVVWREDRLLPVFAVLLAPPLGGGADKDVGTAHRRAVQRAFELETLLAPSRTRPPPRPIRAGPCS
jgi:hypothetical protein